MANVEIFKWGMKTTTFDHGTKLCAGKIILEEGVNEIYPHQIIGLSTNNKHYMEFTAVSKGLKVVTIPQEKATDLSEADVKKLLKRKPKLKSGEKITCLPDYAYAIFNDSSSSGLCRFCSFNQCY